MRALEVDESAWRRALGSGRLRERGRGVRRRRVRSEQFWFVVVSRGAGARRRRRRAQGANSVSEPSAVPGAAPGPSEDGLLFAQWQPGGGLGLQTTCFYVRNGAQGPPWGTRIQGCTCGMAPRGRPGAPEYVLVRVEWRPGAGLGPQNAWYYVRNGTQGPAWGPRIRVFTCRMAPRCRPGGPEYLFLRTESLPGAALAPQNTCFYVLRRPRGWHRIQGTHWLAFEV